MIQAQEWLEKRYSNKENINIIGLDYNEEKISGKLMIKDFPNLKEIMLKNSYDGYKNDQFLTKLEIINCPRLVKLICANHMLTVLNMNKVISLQEIWCSNNKLSNLNLTRSSKLKKIYCQGNQLTELDLSNNHQLTVLDCQVNQLANLNLNNNKQLEYLCCVNNKLSSLDLSNNARLTKLLCGTNFLVNLDISNNHKLFWFECFPNPQLKLSQLRISKNITNFSAYPMIFFVQRSNGAFQKTVEEIWDELVEKFNREYYEMELINVSDLTSLTKQLSLASLNNCELLSKFIPKKLAESLGKSVYFLSLRIILDNLSNQLLARCFTVRSRLVSDKDEGYENKLWELALDFQKCGHMNKKHALQEWEIETLVSKTTFFRDDELLSRIADLEYIKPEYRLKKGNEK